MTDLLWWHRAGQMVVCVDDAPPAKGGPYRLVKDRVYTISVVGLSANDRVAVSVAEEGGDRAVWWVERFRPLRETSIESLRALLNPPPDAKREVFEEMIAEAGHG